MAAAAVGGGGGKAVVAGLRAPCAARSAWARLCNSVLHCRTPERAWGRRKQTGAALPWQDSL